MVYKLFNKNGESADQIFYDLTRAESAAVTTTADLTVKPVCPACLLPVKQLLGKGFKMNAWECDICGRVGC